MTDTLQELGRILEQRKHADPARSYAASLYSQGAEAILKKVAEESAELIEAARAGEPASLVHEVADLWFHTLVLLAHAGLGPQQVLDELARRAGRSGLEEKRGRHRK